jgi:hypothetical protein
LRGFSRRLRLPAIAKVRARRLRFERAKTTPPTTTCLRETAQACSLIVTETLDGAAACPSAGNASSAKRAADSPSKAAPAVRRSMPLFSAAKTAA